MIGIVCLHVAAIVYGQIHVSLLARFLLIHHFNHVNSIDIVGQTLQRCYRHLKLVLENRQDSQFPASRL